jgi:immune inhibitor A
MLHHRIGRFLLLTALLLPLWAHFKHPSRAQEPAAQATLAALRGANLPSRDAESLARRFLGLQSAPIPAQSAPTYQRGDQKSFNAINLDTQTYFSFKAELWLETEHALWWFEVGFTPDTSDLARSAAAFEKNIYPVLQSVFGSEANPGIDGDPRVYVVHGYDLGASVGAYYEPDSEYAQAVMPRSNQHQMFMVNLTTMRAVIGQPAYEAVLAHEFQHMIHNNVDLNEFGWLDEGLAELAAARAGYRQKSGFVGAFMREPNTQVNTWNSVGNSSAHYGASYLLAAFFSGRAGDAGVRALVAEPADGLAAYANVLAATNNGTLDSFFADWLVANLINDPAQPRYAYQNMPTTIPSLSQGAPLRVGENQPLSLKQWAGQYLPVQRNGRYQLTFTAEPTVPLIAAPARQPGPFWYAARGDQSEARLTRAFDLRTTSKATLSFDAWYDIERDWDFAYVQVSADAGQTWQNLPSSKSQPADGKANPYGPAITGSSQGWQTISADLSAYGGREILLRFSLLTDAAVNLDGLALNAINIAEIGYNSLNNPTEGWQAEGWACVENVLPTRVLVQEVAYLSNGSIRVTPLLLPSEEIATFSHDFEVGNGVNAIIFIFSGLTEFTTQPTQAVYSLARR